MCISILSDVTLNEDLNADAGPSTLLSQYIVNLK